MAAKGKDLSRNPNVCFSCSSVIDGEEQPVEYQLFQSSAGNSEAPGKPKAVRQAARWLIG